MHELPELIGKREDLHCPSCNRFNVHEILVAYKTSWGDADTISGGGTHTFLRCNGCGSGTYRTVEWNSEDQDRSETLHPPRGFHTRQPKVFHHVPWISLLNQIYKQTITAFNSGLLTLAGAGVRLLTEGICKEQGVTRGPVFNKDNGAQFISVETGRPVISDKLAGKINGMVERDLISKKQARHLHEIRFLGNDAAHEPYIPEQDVVVHALDIIEHILEQVYEQEEKANALATRDRP